MHPQTSSIKFRYGTEPLQVPQRAVRLSKEPVQHMVKACAQHSSVERLVAITDEGVTMYALPDLSLKGQAFRTKGATAMAWQSASQTLAVARPGSLGKPNQCEPTHRCCPDHERLSHHRKHLMRSILTPAAYMPLLCAFWQHHLRPAAHKACCTVKLAGCPPE